MNAVAPSADPIPAPVATASTRQNRLYLGTAILVAVVAFAGFAPTYWMPMAAGTLSLHPLMHVHGTLFFLWPLFFVLQAALVTRGRTAWHRELGLAGIALAAMMVFAGVLAQIVSLRAGLEGAAPFVARNVAALGFSAMLMFSVFVGLAIANIRRPAIHRRLMVMASFAILGAATVRLMRFVPDLTQPERALIGAVLVDLMLLGVVMLDRRDTGRVHPAWLLGGGFLVVNQVVRTLIPGTATWIAFTDWLASL